MHLLILYLMTQIKKDFLYTALIVSIKDEQKSKKRIQNKIKNPKNYNRLVTVSNF